MRSVLFVLVLSQAVYCQYDDLSVLEEVLGRTSQRPVIRQLPVEGTTAAVVVEKELPSVQPTSETEKPSTESTVIVSSSLPTVGEILSTFPTVESSSTDPETTSKASSITEEAIRENKSSSTTNSPSTELPTTVEETTFSVVEETTDDMLFMGMKRPDLATIYRRLFPFRN